MPPRANRHNNQSQTSSPSSTPPNPNAGGLTKRQRQAQLKIHRPPLPPSPDAASPTASSPVAASPPIASSPLSTTFAARDVLLKDEDVGVEEREEREVDDNAIRMIRPVLEEERERASPSKYPTPLPDDDDDDEEAEQMGALRIAAPAVPLEMEMEMNFQEEELRAEAMEELRAGATEEVPTGTLIDMQDEAEEAYVHQPQSNVPAPMVAREVDVASRAAAAVEPVPTRARAVVDIEPEPVLHHGGEFGRRPRRRHSPPAETPMPFSHGQQAHLRAPEAPRHPPPRALSALSHTLRALAASTQAVTSTATAYAQSHSYLSGPSYSSHSQRATSQPYDARESGDEEAEPILGARWDEVLDWCVCISYYLLHCLPHFFLFISFPHLYLAGRTSPYSFPVHYVTISFGGSIRF
ncbi:hypothetical protein C8F04DRAFT_683334 [Mycena alexandri]|uniref:Uncharacterized protein n=1 Tax=Mycena alexandri TaxID=1745969 RepID=A0AAD6XG24_9AGAR|nr:hypothetical protein C8F04DRAFT_683334 [Mycena alexandri]